MATKKVKSTGRFGAKYGVRIRKRLLAIERSQKKKYVCPKCRAQKVARDSAGIWICSKCGLKFAGGAYNPALSE